MVEQGHAIKLIEVPLRPKASRQEVAKYGISGLRVLWMDILERYANEEYYAPEIIRELTEREEGG